MPTLTLTAARQALFKYASNVAYADATTAEKLAVDTVINQVIERFLTSGKWRGTNVRATFTVYDNLLTLPRTLETVIGCNPLDDDGNSCGRVPVYNSWYSIAANGPGNTTSCCTNGLIDLGEGWPSFRDPSGTFYMRAVSELAEAGKTILFRGLNASGDPIYTSTNVEGVSLNIASAGAATTSQTFTRLDYWVKSAPTNGIVRLYSVDTTTAVATLIAVILPGETVSNLRRYAVPWADTDNDDTVSVIAKRAYFPAVSDNDPLYPSHIGALKLGMMSLQFEDKNDLERATQYMNQALDLLDQDRQEFDGDAVPMISFAGDYGAGSVLNLM